MKRRLLELFAVIILLLGVILPVFKPYVSGTADGLGHRFRLVSFFHSLQDGNLRPRWAKDAAFGYGAPIFLYNYPLPYYLTSLLLHLGFSVNFTGQLFAAFCLFLSAVFMFLAGKKLGGLLGGLTAALVYTYAPYHLQMTYLYDSWGEMLAFIFPPLILYLILKITDCFGCGFQQIQKSKPKIQNYNSKLKILNFKLNFCTLHFALLTIVWVFFILSHNVSALMFSPILLALAFLASRFRIRFFLPILNAFILAIAISSFFWFPAWAMKGEIKYLQFSATETAMRGSFFKSFSFQIQTAFNVIRQGSADYYDFTIGLPILAGGLFALFSLIKGVTRKTGDTSEGFPNGASPALSPDSIGAILKRSLGDASGRTRLEGRKKKGFETDSNYSYWLVGLLILLLLCLYLTNHASNWIWNLPLVLWMPPSYILYPFRFLIAASFIGALLVGILVRRNYPLALVLIVLSIIQGRPYTNPSIDIFPFPDSYFWQKQTAFFAPSTRKNLILIEHLPKMANLDFLKKEEEKHYQESFMDVDNQKREEAFISSGEGSIYEIQSLSEEVKVKLEAKKEVTLTVNRFYFPNWQARVDGEIAPVQADAFGRMTISLPQGTHQISLIFGYLPIEKYANLIALSGLVILAGELIFFKLRKV